MKKIFLIFAFLLSNNALASESQVGKIKQLAVFQANNYAFRVYLEGKSSMCSSNMPKNWAYVAGGHDNYDSLAAAFLSAYAMDATVGIYTHVGSNDFCVIESIHTLKK